MLNGSKVCLLKTLLNDLKDPICVTCLLDGSLLLKLNVVINPMQITLDFNKRRLQNNVHL